MIAKPGTYALILQSSYYTNIKVGKLGMFKIRPGFYLYTGSAFGPGGLRARIKYHSHISQKPHWHIDYLKSCTKTKEAWITYDSQHREHQWAQLLRESPAWFVPLRGFGASDCNCESHLFFFKEKPFLRKFRKIIKIFYPEHSIIKSLRINNLL